MGIIVNSAIQLPTFFYPVSNTYIAFGTTRANIDCFFDTAGNRMFTMNINYRIWYDRSCYMANLSPITCLPVTYTGNVQQVSNVQYFLEESIQTMYPDSYTDGIDN